MRGFGSGIARMHREMDSFRTLGAVDRTGDAWVTDPLIAKLLADVRNAVR